MLVRAIAAALLVSSALSGARAEPSLQHSCLAVGDGYEHVVAIVPKPQDCCTGRLQCSQYLSTTTVVRPGREQHT
jgi:hypothetical protein